MIIKPIQKFNPLDKKISKVTPKKSESLSDEASFSDLLSEIDVIEISGIENDTSKKKEDSEQQSKNSTSNKSKLDKFV